MHTKVSYVHTDTYMHTPTHKYIYIYIYKMRAQQILKCSQALGGSIRSNGSHVCLKRWGNGKGSGQAETKGSIIGLWPWLLSPCAVLSLSRAHTHSHTFTHTHTHTLSLSLSLSLSLVVQTDISIDKRDYTHTHLLLDGK